MMKGLQILQFSNYPDFLKIADPDFEAERLFCFSSNYALLQQLLIMQIGRCSSSFDIQLTWPFMRF